MTMIYCPECKKEVSETAKSCPHCGYHLKASNIEYEYMTLAIHDCTNKFQARYWMIPDLPPPGVIPPTIDEIKEIYLDDMTLKQPLENDVFKHIERITPPGWEIFERISPAGIKLRITKSNGPMGWTTNYSFDSYVFHVRRPLKKTRRNTPKLSQKKKPVAISKKISNLGSHTKKKKNCFQKISQKQTLANPKAAEQSVQWIGGILRDLQAFFWLRVFLALRHYPSPPYHHYR